LAAPTAGTSAGAAGRAEAGAEAGAAGRAEAGTAAGAGTRAQARAEEEQAQLEDAAHGGRSGSDPLAARTRFYWGPRQEHCWRAQVVCAEFDPEVDAGADGNARRAPGRGWWRSARHTEPRPGVAWRPCGGYRQRLRAQDRRHRVLEDRQVSEGRRARPYVGQRDGDYWIRLPGRGYRGYGN